MASIHYDEISYAEIISFMKVAQSLNMSLAAKELHVSQPAISKRIANMESKYGLILFIRSNKGLQLTPAGKAFYQELLASQEHLRTAFTAAAAAQAAPMRELRLYYDGFFDLPLLKEIMDDYAAAIPGARIRMYYGHKEDCSDLFNGAADLMLCPDSFTQDIMDHVSMCRVGAFQFYILVSAENPLAERETLTLTDLLGVPLTVAHNNADSPYIRTIQSLFEPLGFSPKIEHLATMESLCFEIVSNAGVAIASPAFWQRMNARNVAYFQGQIRAYPIPDAWYPVSLVWRTDDNDGYVERFVKCFRTRLATDGNQTLIDSSYGNLT